MSTKRDPLSELVFDILSHGGDVDWEAVAKDAVASMRECEERMRLAEAERDEAHKDRKHNWMLYKETDAKLQSAIQENSRMVRELDKRNKTIANLTAERDALQKNLDGAIANRDEAILELHNLRFENMTCGPASVRDLVKQNTDLMERIDNQRKAIIAVQSAVGYGCPACSEKKA